ncbi:hypothetical protein Tco_0228081 [Tanacetum coccineum]
MDNPNITMEEYIRLEEEKARQHGKVYNWETAKYGKIWYDEDVHDLRSVETEFPAIVFNDKLSFEKTLSCEPTISSLNNNETDFRISFDESDDEDYTVIFDKNSFSYKIIYVNDLKTDSENDNEKVNMPSFASPEPKVGYFDDLDFFKDYENEFPAIVYNDALTSKSDFLTEPTLCPQHIDEFDLKDEKSLFEYDEVEQNVLYFNDLFPFNIIYPDDLKSGKDNDDNKIDIIQSSGGNVNTQGQKKFLEASHDKINKIFIMEDFIMELNVNIMAWNYLVNGMLLNLIKNLYGSSTLRSEASDADGAQGCLGTKFREGVLDLDTDGALQFQLGGARDPMLRLYHRLISCSIAGRSQAPEKVFEVVRFREEGLMVIMRDLPVIDMAELVRPQICMELDNTWAWVAPGPERQPDVVAGAPKAAEDAPVADEGALAVPAPVPQPPPPTARPTQTMAQRLARVEEDVHKIRGALGEQREILDSMAHDFS